jgi:hypothetical protein
VHGSQDRQPRVKTTCAPAAPCCTLLQRTAWTSTSAPAALIPGTLNPTPTCQAVCRKPSMFMDVHVSSSSPGRSTACMSASGPARRVRASGGASALMLAMSCAGREARREARTRVRGGQTGQGCMQRSKAAMQGLAVGSPRPLRLEARAWHSHPGGAGASEGSPEPPESARPGERLQELH